VRNSVEVDELPYEVLVPYLIKLVAFSFVVKVIVALLKLGSTETSNTDGGVISPAGIA
jgi:hypothetical protein